VLAFGWWPYTEAESAWRLLFERYVNPNFGKNHAKHRRHR
jgi:hypothetical protein